MISIKYSADNEYGKFGVEHFIEKYGLPVEYHGNNIGYKLEASNGSFSIRVSNGKVGNRICGFLNSEIPVFEHPKKTSSGKAIVYLTKGNDVYPCVSYSDRNIEIGFDVFSEVGHLLSGHTESLRGTAKYHLVSRLPIADYYEKLIFDSMLFAGKKLDVPIVRKSFWPEGREFALCLTHDLDEVKKKYQYLTRSLKSIKDMNLKGLKNQSLSLMSRLSGAEPYWDCLESLQEIERKYNVTSTIFFLNETAKVKSLEPSSWIHYGRKFDIKAPYIVNRMRELERDGWEVGVHGSYYSYRDANMLKDEKKELDRLLGIKTIGTRQHHLNMEIPDTFVLQEKAGFKYDSTLGCNESPCFRWGTCLPFNILDCKTIKKLSLIEIPLIIEDTALNRIKTNIWDECTRLIDVVKSYNGVLTLLWHHVAFDRHECPGWAQEYERIIEFCKKHGAWVTNGRRIYSWWSERSSFKPSISFGDGKLEILSNSKDMQYVDIFPASNSKYKTFVLKEKKLIKMW